MYRNCGLISNSLKLLPCLFMLFAPSYRLSWLSPHKHGTFLTPAHIQTYQCCWEECTWNLSDSEDNYDYKFSNKNTRKQMNTSWHTLYLQTSDTAQFHLQLSCTSSTLACCDAWHDQGTSLMKHCHLVWETKEWPLSLLPFTQV